VSDSDGDNLEDVEQRHEALVARLRRLSWPQPAPGVRERRLEELREMLERMNAEAPTAEEGRDR
jgi:hypothetical protein